MKPPIIDHRSTLEIHERDELDNLDYDCRETINLDSNSGPPLSDGNHHTIRAVVVGLSIGILLCFYNVYFGLQTG